MQTVQKITAETKKKFLTVFAPDTRGVSVSRFGRGNLKIGLDGVYTYSRTPGNPDYSSQDNRLIEKEGQRKRYISGGTCPGSTPECEAVCYAKRVVDEDGLVAGVWKKNAATEDLPSELPDDCKFLRIHIGGDFSSLEYILNWRALLRRYPEVKVWAYTRSWRDPKLVGALDILRELPNVTIFASMDKTTEELPPPGWRIAWIDGDERARGEVISESDFNFRTAAGTSAYVCPEQVGRAANCVACSYCFAPGAKGDVIFLNH